MGLFQGLNTVIQMQAITNSSPVTGQVWFDGTNLRMNIGGTNYYLSNTPVVGSQFTVSNVTPTTSFNASAATLTTTNAVLGTLLQALQTANI